MAGVTAAVMAFAVVMVAAHGLRVIVQSAFKEGSHCHVGRAGNAGIPLDSGHVQSILSAHTNAAANQCIRAQTV